ncbi:3-deoxy-7-phosphoheptulonate synthase [Streptomyces sp. NPDC059168]|uniref:3-deoxy-7-phosphoheptulonate synthase n=1 Tax=Streptomyces sp. NPDC059168 TaxID=3346753 RepID=UPI0036784E7D
MTRDEAAMPLTDTADTDIDSDSPTGPSGTAAPRPVPAALPQAQRPDWPDTAELLAVSEELSRLPALVLAAECDRLTDRLAAVSRGEAILLQGGDCAETFAAVNQAQVSAKFRTLGHMAAVLGDAAELPVVQVGRIAGQFSKPRSSPTETRDGVTLPAYRGDMINDLAFDPRGRAPDPRRLRRAYDASAATLNLLRALAADQGSEFFSSHEALVLEYERALSRDALSGAYALSAHLLWIGERTRRPDGAHIDFAARVRNPVAVKLGPSTTADDALALVDRLDPDRRPGRLTFIARMGASAVRDVLPDLVAKVTASGSPVVWVCDPMHGNTVHAPSGHKTRRFDDILDEVTGFFEVHQAMSTQPGGVHVELTGEQVTECLGGTYEVLPSDLPSRYESACDPRLNRSQALDLAFLLADRYAKLTPTGSRSAAER